MPADACARGRRALVRRTTWASVELRADWLKQLFAILTFLEQKGVEMIRSATGLFAVLIHSMAYAGFGGMGNVESDGGSYSGGPVPISGIVAVIVGAVCGCLIERYLNAADLRKKGATDMSGFYLGGKVGAAIGAFAGPFILGLFR